MRFFNYLFLPLRNEHGFLPMLMAAIGGGIINAISQDNTNRQAQNMSEDQMKFQERMSSTAHQREVEDLKLAGLNPVLSAGGNGSSSPAGSSPSLTAPQIDLPGVMSFYMQNQQLEQQQQRINIEKANSAAGIAKSLSETDLNKMKKILAQKGMLRAELEGDATSVMKNMMNFLRNKWQENKPPEFEEEDPWDKMGVKKNKLKFDRFKP